jgi:hypothetical protein
MDNYGNGPSTGLDQTALGKITTGFVPEDVAMSDADKAILRKLAEQVAAIAATDEMAAKRKLWTDLNGLRSTRPVIFCDPENGWNEIITENQMECSGKLARRWEMDLKKEIFWGTVMGDDRAVEPVFDVPYTVAPDDWGVETVFHDSGADSGAQSWDGPIQNYERDLPKLQTPPINIDWETTNGCKSVADDVFGGILEVRLKGTWWWTLGLTLPAVMLRGMTPMFMDLIDQPDNLKALLKFISDSNMKKLDFLEENNLLSLNSDGTYVGSGGYGYSDELPAPDFAGKVRCKDMWGFTESQETVSVSPAMYEEFIFPYEKPIMDRFGLTCYGCCEPIDPRWHIVKRHHKLRRVSCSPWANKEKMAENLKRDYIYSMKPNPADLSRPTIDTDTIRKDLREAFEITKGCVVEVIMKDNHTIGGRPENLTEWCKIAKEEADRVAG